MPTRYRFGPGHRFVLDPTARTLLAEGQPVPLGARAFDLLVAFAEAGGELLTKERLLQRGWPGLVVEEANLHVQVSQLRKLLGAEAIATVQAVGYRFAWAIRQNGQAALQHNLPAARTGFVGREAVLEQARRHLAGTRLLTLIGIGGTGKTRLALKLAEELLPAFADGVWWVDLAPLSEAEQVAPAVALALGVKPQDANPEALAAWLRDRQLLLVLDNCEHLLDDSAQLVDALLGAAPNLRVLATSREALGLPGEGVLPVRPLALPAAAAPIETVLASEAVRLFAERAALAAPWFTLATGEAATVAEICRRVDGIPLALELAAAQLRVVGPAQLLDLLQQRFRVLGGPRRALPRQQTMQAVIQWSFEHLHAEEQRLLTALALCSGGCDLIAAAALLGSGTAPATLLASLGRLAEQSLLVVQHGQGPAPHPARYHLLETVRQFALDRLHAGSEVQALRDRHAAHYLALAENHEAGSTRHGEGAATVAQLDVERDNLLRALETCDRDDSAEAVTTGLRLVAALRHYWAARGLLALGLRVTLAALRRAEGRPVDRHQIMALVAATQMLWWSRELDEAQRLAQQLARQAEAFGDPASVAAAHLQIGQILDAQGRLDEAESEFEKARRLALDLDDSKLLADVLGSLGWLARTRGRAHEAAPLFDEVLALRRQSGHGYRIALALLNAGSTAAVLGDAPRARGLLREAATLMRQVGNQVLDLHLTDITAELAALEGRWPEAVQLRAAAAAQRRVAHSPRHPADEQQVQEELLQARSALGAPAFEAAWSQGEALEREQSLAAVARCLDMAPAAPAGP
jgi:non-specific serine/threonine protein kinase